MRLDIVYSSQYYEARSTRAILCHYNRSGRAKGYAVHGQTTVGILVYDVFTAFLRRFQSPVLTRGRVRLAYAIAATADVLQLVLGPFGWAFADELLDMVAMLLTWWLIGFHPLLLPTFALEFQPVADMLPTWTGCVAVVAGLRKRQ